MKNKHITLLLILFISTNIFSQAKKDFRDNIDIIHYNINLNITDFENKKISGNTVIKIKALKKDLKKITLELQGLKVDSVFVNNQNCKFIHDESFLNISISKLILQNQFEVNIYYHGKPTPNSDTWGGFFFKKGYVYNMGVAMTDKPHSYGRVWYPCIDKLSEKATYNFVITVPKDYTAVCSGVLVNTKSNKDNTETYFWEMNNEIPAYLTSVAVGKYKKFIIYYKRENKKIPIEVYVKPELFSKAAGSFVNIEKAVRCFEKYFGPYHWGRVGYVTIPFSSGAMEHACNIAYPEYAVNGTTDREMLMVHELAHSWFGNLVTCKTPEDMWLNEGIASFAEVLFKEYVYGKLEAKNYIRDNHESVLKNCHVYDNGYKPLYGLSHQYTYGSTVYDKGSDITHTLRGYLGDKLFFDGISAYLGKYSFKSASTVDFCGFLSKYTRTDLSDFIKSWVLTAGFPHFSIKSFSSTQRDKNFRVKIDIQQKLKERVHFGGNNKAEITCFDKNLNSFTQKITFSGKLYSKIITVPFNPENVFFDLEEKISDATIDNYKIISEIGRYAFPNTDFSILIDELRDSVLIRSTMNYITATTKTKKYKLNNTSYWSITGINNDYFTGKGIFYVNIVQSGINKKLDNIVLLYRKNEFDDWKEISFKIDKTDLYSGNIIVSNLKFGDYVIGSLK